MTTMLRASALLLPVLLAACASQMRAPDAPQAVTPPAGSKFAMTTVGIGEITYECRAKAGAAGAFEWVFVAPVATLYDGGAVVGKYYGGPTWEANDGSKVTGKQLAVSPAPGTGNIPLQLVQANPAMGNGAMTDVTYIQRLNTMGGVAPSAACASANVGAKQQVKYQADYVFYKK
jgi:hypothetical protein